MIKVSDLTLKIFADGADKNGILEMYEKENIKGLTTNPTLMKKVGITDYRAFCKDILVTVTNDILNKSSLVGYDLDEYSLDTVKMFYNDAVSAGFKLKS